MSDYDDLVLRLTAEMLRPVPEYRELNQRRSHRGKRTRPPLKIPMSWLLEEAEESESVAAMPKTMAHRDANVEIRTQLALLRQSAADSVPVLEPPAPKQEVTRLPPIHIPQVRPQPVPMRRVGFDPEAARLRAMEAM